MKKLFVEVVRIAMVSQIEPDDIEAVLVQRLRQRKHIQRLSAAFPTVQEYGERPPVLRHLGPTSTYCRRGRKKRLQSHPVTTV